MAQLLLIGDPDRFQVDRAILRSMSREEVLWWPVGRIAASIRAADTAYLLRLESENPSEQDPGGLIGIARVVGAAEQRAYPNPDLWIGRMPTDACFVPLDVQEARLSKEAGMVLREPFRKMAALAKLGLQRRRSGQEARLTPDQSEAFRVLWKRTAAQTLL